MRVVGLVASARRGGNCELLTNLALARARTLGADVAMLRLPDLDLRFCNGCLSCAMKRQSCRIHDDLDFLLTTLEQCDGFVLSAPVYFLGAPAVIKTIVDRLLSLKENQLAGRKVVTLGVAGRAEWGRMFHSQLNMLPLVAGCDVVDSCLIEGPGPGETLLDAGNLARVEEMVAALMSSLRGESNARSEQGSCCPLCRGESFRLIAPSRVECPLCYTQGEVVGFENGKPRIKFDRNAMEFRLFGKHSLEEHLDEWVRATAPRFREKLRDIRQKRAELLREDIPWLAPTRG